MTPKQKLRWAIVDRALQYEDKPGCSGDDVDELYDQLEDAGGLQDAVQEIRCGGIDTGLSCESSRHYESTAVAMKVPDGSWVGWTYWYGGGKHSEPEAIDWMNAAYDVECKEEEKLVIVQTFNKTTKDRPT